MPSFRYLLIFPLIISIASCSGGGDGDDPDSDLPTFNVSGRVSGTNDLSSRIDGRTFSLSNLTDFILGKSFAAITGLAPLSGANVELWRLGPNGRLTGAPLLTTTTDASGNYSLSLPNNFYFSSDLAVVVSEQSADATDRYSLIAFASGFNVDINPISTFFFDEIVNTIGFTVDQYSLDSLLIAYQNIVDEFDADFSGVATLEEALSLLNSNAPLSTLINNQRSYLERVSSTDIPDEFNLEFLDGRTLFTLPDTGDSFDEYDLYRAQFVSEVGSTITSGTTSFSPGRIEVEALIGGGPDDDERLFFATVDGKLRVYENRVSILSLDNFTEESIVGCFGEQNKYFLVINSDPDNIENQFFFFRYTDALDFIRSGGQIPDIKVNCVAEADSIVVDGIVDDWATVSSTRLDEIGEPQLPNQEPAYEIGLDIKQFGIAIDSVNNKIKVMFEHAGDFAPVQVPESLNLGSYIFYTDIHMIFYTDFFCESGRYVEVEDFPSNRYINIRVDLEEPNEDASSTFFNDTLFFPEIFMLEPNYVDPMNDVFDENLLTNIGGQGYSASVGTSTYEASFTNLWQFPYVQEDGNYGYDYLPAKSVLISYNTGPDELLTEECFNFSSGL